jgi:hypothetical protein
MKALADKLGAAMLAIEKNNERTSMRFAPPSRQ